MPFKNNQLFFIAAKQLNWMHFYFSKNKSANTLVDFFLGRLIKITQNKLAESLSHHHHQIVAY